MIRRDAMFRRAYTLVELLVVVVILGIAAALVTPAMGGTSVLRVQAAVRTIVADITEAQSEALAYQKGRAIVYYPDEKRWAIVEVKGAILDPVLDLVRGGDIKGADFGDSTIATVNFDGDNVLVFDEMGSPVTTPGGSTPGASGVITVTGSGQAFTITVEAYTGRVVVKRTAG